MNIQFDTHFSNQLLFLTVRIAGRTSAGSGSCGTGFFYDLSGAPNAQMETMLLVTNKHVIADLACVRDKEGLRPPPAGQNP